MQPAAVDRILGPMVISVHHTLPPYCCRCDGPADFYTTVSRKSDRGGESALVRLSLLLISPLLWLFTGPKSRVIVTMPVPICEPCFRAAPVEPVSVDFQDGAMTFLVHRDWKRRVTGGVGP